MLRPSIGIDWDDVTAPFNSIAIRMANEKYHPEKPYRLEEITSWANEGRTSVPADADCGCFFYYGGIAAFYGSAGRADHDAVPGASTGEYYIGKCERPCTF